MRTLREWLIRFWGTLRPRRADADLEQELRAHLELAAEAAGRSDEAGAARAAIVRAGARHAVAGGPARSARAAAGSRSWRATSGTPRGRCGARRVRRCGDPHARDRHRRQHRGVQHPQRHPAQAARVSRTRRAGRGLAVRARRRRAGRRVRRSAALPLDVLHLRRTEPQLRASRRLVRGGGNVTGYAEPEEVRGRVRLRRRASGTRCPAGARPLAVAADQAPNGPRAVDA